MLRDGQYFLRFEKSTWSNIVTNGSVIDLLVDGNKTSFNAVDEGQDLKVGPLNFLSGNHEIVPTLGELDQIKVAKPEINISDKNLATNFSNNLDSFQIAAQR